MFKKGNVYIISLFVIIIIIILFTIFILFAQINNSIYTIKNDLFYIVQNAYLSINNEELAYNNYIIDDNIMQEKVNELLKLNFPKTSLKIIRLQYENGYVNIAINFHIKPLILSKIIGNLNITIKDSIKLKLMEVKSE